MKLIKNIVIIFAFIGILIWTKYYFFPTKITQTNPGQKLNTAIPVRAIICQATQSDEQIYLSGNLIANEEVTLFPETAGKISQIFFKEGQVVAQSQLLVKLNDDELIAQREKLNQQLKLNELKETRLKPLLQNQAISQNEYDELLLQIQNIRADLNINQTFINKTAIRAPFKGTIGLKNISIGSYVNSSTRIASLQQLDPIKVEFYVPEKYINRIKTGDNIFFTVDESAKNSAKIFAIEPTVDEQTRTIKVRALFNNNKKYLPGMFAKIELNFNAKERTIQIPNEAIIPDLKGKKVFVYKNEKVESVSIVSGFRNDQQTQILQGLKENDTVIISGIQQIKTGTKVLITELK